MDLLKLFLVFTAFIFFFSVVNAEIIGTESVPIGSLVDVNVSGTDISLQFAEVTVGGNVTIERELECAESFEARGSCIYISTDATYTEGFGVNEGIISCLSYADFEITDFTNKEYFEVRHFNGSEWYDATQNNDFGSNTICARVSNLSPFAIYVGSMPSTIRRGVPGMGMGGFFMTIFIALIVIFFRKN